MPGVGVVAVGVVVYGDGAQIFAAPHLGNSIGSPYTIITAVVLSTEFFTITVLLCVEFYNFDINVYRCTHCSEKAPTISW